MCDPVAEVASDGRYPPRTQQITSKRAVSNGSSPTSVTRRNSLENRNKKTGPAMFRKLDRKKPNDQKLRTLTAPHPLSSLSVNDDHLNNKFARPQTKRALFNEIVDEDFHESEFQHARFSSTVVGSNITVDVQKSHKDTEELALIRNQLAQIESQQSNLVDLLQKFIGSSETGMRSLETRVHGLELTLDEISFDLARSSGRLSHPEPLDTLCWKLPGADFLTSKLWKKTEIHHSNARVSASPFSATNHMVAKNRGFRRQGGGCGLIKNPLAEV